MINNAISVVCDDTDSSLCRHLYERLSTSAVSSKMEAETRCVLRVQGECLSLALPGYPQFKPISLDFNNARDRAGDDPLLKAIGRKSKSVIDTTAGWGTDALHLARASKEVIALEKSEVVYVMLDHAWNQIQSAALKSRLNFIQTDSAYYLERMTTKADVIYLDPMFPVKGKSSKSKKNLQILQSIVGESINQQKLLEIALTRASQRVVVKRPHYAPPIQSGKVGEIKTKLIRFDIYKPVDA